MIRNSALRLFAEHGPDAVTVRQIATAAGVSPALVVHHFGSKDGLRVACDAYAAKAFDAVLDAMEGADLGDLLAGGNAGSIAAAFAQGFPAGSPLPAYLRRLLLAADPAGAALFGRWYRLSLQLLESMTASGLAKPSADLPVRAAFLLVNDLALILLRNEIATAVGDDPLSLAGMTRWAAEVTAVYRHGAFTQGPTAERP